MIDRTWNFTICFIGPAAALIKAKHMALTGRSVCPLRTFLGNYMNLLMLLIRKTI